MLFKKLRYRARSRKGDNLGESGKATTASNTEDLRYEPLKDARKQVRMLQLARQKSEQGWVDLAFEMTVHDLSTLQYVEGSRSKDSSKPPLRASERYYRRPENEHTRKMSFAAISYEWGSDPHDELFILVNGKRKFVRRTCFAALLQALNWLEQGSKIWIDSICVNQDDLQEKSAQVNLMPEIYEASCIILACVGMEADGSAELLDYFANADLEDHGSQIGQLSSGLWGALLALANRTYWTRLWGFPEIIRAWQVGLLCGNHSMSLERFHEAWNRVSRYYSLEHIDRLATTELKKTPFSATHLHYNEFITGRFERVGNVRSLLYVTQSLKCSDPRDRIYAYLALFRTRHEKEAIAHLPQADYTISAFEVAVKILKADTSTINSGTIELLLDSLEVDTDNRGWKAAVFARQQPAVLDDTKQGSRGPATIEIAWASRPHYFEIPLDWTPQDRQVIGLPNNSIAFLCDKATGGDFILPLRDKYLIVRRVGDETYDILGQAIVVDETDLSVSDMYVTTEARMLRLGKFPYVRMSPVEAVAYFA